MFIVTVSFLFGAKLWERFATHPVNRYLVATVSLDHAVGWGCRALPALEELIF